MTMKKLIKPLTVTRLEMVHRAEGKYRLTLTEPRTWGATESVLTLTAHDMVRFGLDPGEELLGSTLAVTLEAVPYPRKTTSPDAVCITGVSRSTQVQHHYAMFPPDKSERHTYRLEAKTPVDGGSLVVLPSTYYELDLRLTEGEYRRLRSLPASTALLVTLRRVDGNFRDVVLTWRATLDDDRVFPKDYAPRMVLLIRAMLAYFDGDVDRVGHYCGLETEGERANKRTRTWQREYFAVDAHVPRRWEAAFSRSVARIDAILKERYNNRLPSSAVREFYDNVETSAWESKQWHPVEEASVGLQAKYVFQKQHHLPCLTVEARSTVGNRKACEAVCETLSREASALFGVRFDHVSLSREEIRRGANVPDETQAEP
jgi:hypothetical protein